MSEIIVEKNVERNITIIQTVFDRKRKVLVREDGESEHTMIADELLLFRFERHRHASNSDDAAKAKMDEVKALFGDNICIFKDGKHHYKVYLIPGGERNKYIDLYDDVYKALSVCQELFTCIPNYLIPAAKT